MDSSEETDEPSWRGVPATIILINAFDPSTHNTAKVAHVATCRLVRQYLRLSSSQYVGVCLYGAENAGSSIFDIKTVTDLIPLTLPSLDDYKTLKNLDTSKIKQAKEPIMSEVLWHCSKMFANCKKQLSSRTIIILSRLCTPPTQADQDPTFKRVLDLVDSNIEIRIVNVSATNYEIDPFYNNFMIEANKGKDFILPKPVWDPIEIEQLMIAESDRHLAISQLSFEIGNGVSIGVGVYKLLKNYGQTQPKFTYRDSETNAPVVSVTKTMKVTSSTTEHMDVDQEQKQVPLLKSELLYYQEYGGERVAVTANEMKLIQNPFGPPMLKLLGFKPAAILSKEKWFLKNCYFVFPNESLIEGSIVAFKALHQACVEMSMVAICVLCTRVNAKPIIVALSPCSYPLGLDIEKGFDAICVPFVENVRDLSTIEEDDPTEISDTHKNFMRQVLSSVSFDYRPDMFENPKLQSLYTTIEAKALEQDDIEPFIDTTKPNSIMFENINNQLFYELFGPFNIVPAKRTAVSKESNKNIKRERIESIDEELLKNKIDNAKVDTYNVADLKQILKFKNASEALTGLKKKELVDLVYKYCA